jgi:hypothetical protein
MKMDTIEPMKNLNNASLEFIQTDVNDRLETIEESPVLQGYLQ